MTSKLETTMVAVDGTDMSKPTCPWHYAHGTPPAIDAEGQLVATAVVIAEFVPGSAPPPRTWEDEAGDLDARLCCCLGCECDGGSPGWYQRNVEALLREAGHWIGTPARIGNDGVVRDGHHRIVAAWRIGVSQVLILRSDWPPLWWRSVPALAGDRGAVPGVPLL